MRTFSKKLNWRWFGMVSWRWWVSAGELASKRPYDKYAQKIGRPWLFSIDRHSVSSWKIDQTETSWKLYGAILNGWKFISSGWNFYPERLKVLSWTAETRTGLKRETTETISGSSGVKLDWNDWKSILNRPQRLKVCPETLALPSWNILKDPKFVWRRSETDWTTKSQTD